MDAKNKDTVALIDIQNIVSGYIATQAADKSEILKAIDRDSIIHDVASAIQKKIVAMVKACRKSCIGKSVEEREIIMWTTLDKIEEIIAQDVASTRDAVLYGRGKHEAIESSMSALNAVWDAGIGDLQRIDTVADMIKLGAEPINGRNRKPGTRPEKLAVVRKAQEEVEKNQTEFDGKA
jgi:hypothetical protein